MSFRQSFLKFKAKLRERLRRFERRFYPSITAERNVVASVENDCVPYLTSGQIPEGYRLRKVVISIDYEEQGHSSSGKDSGSSWTSFELSLGSSKHSTEAGDKGEGEGAPREKWRGNLGVANDRSLDGTYWFRVWDSELYEKAESGDVLTVWVRSRSTGWTTTVRRVRIEAFIKEIALQRSPMSDRERSKKVNQLSKICSEKGILPRSIHIQGLSLGSAEAERSGGFANVFRRMHDGMQVAVKVMTLTLAGDRDKVFRGFCREAITWRQLRHPNIASLLGVTVDSHRFSMVSEWMENGNVMDFITMDPNANRIEFLVDVTNALAYMHSLNLVHGDLKGANILINGNRRACITDFGLSTVTRSEAHANDTTSLVSRYSLAPFTHGGTYQWMSPELLLPENYGLTDDRPTRESDRWALAMVIYEVLSGHSPYHKVSQEYAMIEIIEGRRPKKPKMAARRGFTKELWKVLEQCWAEDRNQRPASEAILSALNNAAPHWQERKSIKTLVTSVCAELRLKCRVPQLSS